MSVAQLNKHESDKTLLIDGKLLSSPKDLCLEQSVWDMWGFMWPGVGIYVPKPNTLIAPYPAQGSPETVTKHQTLR